MPPENSKNNVAGTGWSFPVETDNRGNIALSEGEKSIKDSIRLIIGTAKGERVMEPEFGCEIHDYVFDTIDGTMRTLVEGSVEEALIKWEPRIDLEDVVARPDSENPNKLLLEINYTVRSTNSESNMVYPFYIDEE